MPCSGVRLCAPGSIGSQRRICVGCDGSSITLRNARASCQGTDEGQARFSEWLGQERRGLVLLHQRCRGQGLEEDWRQDLRFWIQWKDGKVGCGRTCPRGSTSAAFAILNCASSDASDVRDGRHHESYEIGKRIAMAPCGRVHLRIAGHLGSRCSSRVRSRRSNALLCAHAVHQGTGEDQTRHEERLGQERRGLVLLHQRCRGQGLEEDWRQVVLL